MTLIEPAFATPLSKAAGRRLRERVKRQGGGGDEGGEVGGAFWAAEHHRVLRGDREVLARRLEQRLRRARLGELVRELDELPVRPLLVGEVRMRDLALGHAV